MESPSTLSGMCRCCAAEGTFKDIKRSYQWMGEEEVYGDMIRECFDVKLITSEFGGICEMCITHLRNAFNFKKQVLDTEQQFKQHLEAGKFKSPVVKEELSADEDMNDSEDNDMDNIDDEDYVPEFEVPIKTEDLLDEPLKSKKRSAKPTTSRAKKSKSTGIEIKSEQEIDEILVKNGAIVYELDKHRHNIRQIIACTNATPIRKRTDKGYACCFCQQHYEDPAGLKTHTIQDHDNKTKLQFMAKCCLKNFLIKLDITGLECKFCRNKLHSLEDIYEHLTQIHKKKMFLNIKKLILPFKFEDDDFKCAICGDTSSRTFKTLQVHMYSHYDNYVCQICNATFLNLSMISLHRAAVHGTEFKCRQCSEKFDTFSKRRNHEVAEHNATVLPYKCGHCDKRFKHQIPKQKHLAAEHNIKFPTYDCNACDRKFFKPHFLKTHLEKDHMMEKRHNCSECNMAFYYESQLRLHIVSHTKVKEFPCPVCSKMFSRKKSLREHIKIHNNDRRFKCTVCGQAFVQKCSLKRHMETKHD